MAKKPTLTVQLFHAQIRIAELEAALAATAKPANTGRWNTKPVTSTVWVRPAWMEAARNAAMATGSVVLA